MITIIARSLTLSQMIKNDKKVIPLSFLMYCQFESFDIGNINHVFSKCIKARGFNLSQLTENNK